MALVSIVLSVVALVCTLIGFLTTPIPVWGLVFSFGAAGVALAGIMLGGKAQSQAKQAGEPSDMARIAVVLNVIAFVPALLVAVTCGVCNALFSSGNMQLHKDFRFNVDPTFAPDAGPGALPPPPSAPPSEPVQPGQPAAPEPSKTPPGQLPPPPLPAGPGN